MKQLKVVFLAVMMILSLATSSQCFTLVSAKNDSVKTLPKAFWLVSEETDLPKAPPENFLLVVEIEAGDNLWSIAEKYLGDGNRYPEIARENRIANPNKIFPEQRIIVRAEKEIVAYRTSYWVSQFRLAAELAEAKKEILSQKEALSQQKELISGMEERIKQTIKEEVKKEISLIREKREDVAFQIKETVGAGQEESELKKPDAAVSMPIQQDYSRELLLKELFMGISAVLVFIILGLLFLLWTGVWIGAGKREKKYYYKNDDETWEKKVQRLEYSNALLRNEVKKIKEVLSLRQVYLEFKENSKKYTVIFYPRKDENGKFISLFIPEDQKSAVRYKEFADLEKSVKKMLKEYVAADFSGRLEKKFEAVREAEGEGRLFWRPALEVDIFGSDLDETKSSSSIFDEENSLLSELEEELKK